MNPGFRLKGFPTLNQYSPSMNLERNVVAFFDYACLQSSGYQNIYYNSTDYNGQPIGKLKCCPDRKYASGRVWEAYRGNWVWESGSGVNSINVSGVYVNGVYSGSGFNVDYRHGQIIFNSAIPTNSDVRCSYSPKSIYWDTTDSLWFREFVTETYDYSAFDGAAIGSGIRSALNNHRIQLPAVIVSITPESNLEPYQLGGGSWYNPRVEFHIFAENSDQKSLLTDIIIGQNEHSFLGMDFNLMVAANDQPMTPYGFLNSGAKNFPNLQALYPWNVKPITFTNLDGKDIPYVSNTFRALVYGNCNLVLLSI